MKKNETIPKALLVTTRGNTIENTYLGWVCVLGKNNKILYSKGNLNDYIFLRSCAKPIQAIPLISTNIKLIGKELAIMVGSHTGSGIHLALLSEMLEKYDVNLSELKCGVHMPFDPKEKKALLEKKIHATQLHNNCSGKHIGMLIACKHNGWNVKNYTNLSHPLQKKILSEIISLSGTKKIKTAIDGCSVPTFALPLKSIANMFFNFASETKYERIFNSMSTYPYFVGGNGTFDTEIIKLSKGRIVSKSGAEGVIALINRGLNEVAFLKISDGSQKIRSIVAIDLMLKLEWISLKQIEKLKNLYTKKIFNHAKLSVGEFVSVL